MTIATLITDVLTWIRHQYYADRTREFLRDERALTKAIARYGYECERRGWEFEPTQLRAKLLNLLLEIVRSNAQFRYLPTYLEGAVDRHIRQRADDLAAEAKRLAPRARRIVGDVQPVVVVEKTATETLAELYKSLKAAKPRKQHAKPAQPSLF